MRSQFKLVYDDGDSESVRLEADPAKRAEGDVHFRWLPDAAPAEAGGAGGIAEPAAEPAADAEPTAGTSAAPAAADAAMTEAAAVPAAAGGALVEGLPCATLLQDVSNVASADLPPLASPARGGEAACEAPPAAPAASPAPPPASCGAQAAAPSPAHALAPEA
jgi:hypothetical protein